MLNGFLCPLTEQSTPFDFCFKECTHRCHPLPVLLALVDERKFKDSMWSVTELLQPPRITILKRRYNYAIKPMDLMFATFGTAWHLMISQTEKRLTELGLNDGFVFEENNYFEVQFDTPHGLATLRGTPDLYLPDSKILYDFKTTKYYYTMKYILEKGWNGSDTTFHWQINLYRYWKYPETEKMYLYALIKDWNNRLKEIIDPVAELEVPFIDNDKLKSFTQDQINLLQKIQEEKSEPPLCDPKDFWIQKDGKTRLRCEKYCVVNQNCDQYKEYKSEKTRVGN